MRLVGVPLQVQVVTVFWVESTVGARETLTAMPSTEPLAMMLPLVSTEPLETYLEVPMVQELAPVMVPVEARTSATQVRPELAARTISETFALRV